MEAIINNTTSTTTSPLISSSSSSSSSLASSNSDLTIAKIVAMIVLGLSSFILGILPLKLHKYINKNPFKTESTPASSSSSEEKNLFLSLLLCFGGGVLLFTSFIHLQPEVREIFTLLQQRKRIPDLGLGSSIPISELVFCFGFFCVYLIEEVVHLILDRKTSQNQALHRSLSLRYGNGSFRKKSTDNNNVTIPRVNLPNNNGTNFGYLSTSNKDLLNSSQSTIGYLSDKQPNSQPHQEHPQQLEHHHQPSEQEQYQSYQSNNDDSIKNSFTGFLAVLALSFHAVFEGLAVGLESSVQKVWYLFGAIATHKLVIGFCVGMELVTSKTKLMLVVVSIGTFAIVSPLGIGIGIILSNVEGSQENVICVVLQGMAAGTLLYVVFFEVLAREKDNRHNGICQLFAILVGFFFMLGIQVLTGHEHNHGQNQHQHDHHNHDDHI